MSSLSLGPPTRGPGNESWRYGLRDKLVTEEIPPSRVTGRSFSGTGWWDSDEKRGHGCGVVSWRSSASPGSEVRFVHLWYRKGRDSGGPRDRVATEP